MKATMSSLRVRRFSVCIATKIIVSESGVWEQGGGKAIIIRVRDFRRRHWQNLRDICLYVRTSEIQPQRGEVADTRTVGS